MSAPLSVREALRGRRLLVTGASGFLGKVWLGQLLLAAPEVGRVHLLLRGGRAGARARLEGLLGGSPAFEPLHARWGERLGATLSPLLDPLEGDLERPLLGLDQATLAHLRGALDLVVHLGAATELEPDLESALRVNVDGALAALEVARETGAALLHVSTAYVAGAREGLFPAAPLAEAAPDPAAGPFLAERELQDLRRLVLAVEEEARDQRREAALRDEALAALRRQGLVEEPQALAAALERTRAAWARARRIDLGRERARAWGWANAYALSKALAELLLERRGGDVPRCTVRPSIVESALDFPFPGWKEGHQTSAPLLWALTEGPLRALPGRARLRLDVVPVDLVARGITLAAAALLRGEAPPVVQLGTSAENPLLLGRALELTNLARRQGEEETWRSLLLPDATTVGPAGWRLQGPPLLRRLAASAGAALGLAGELLPGRAAARAEDLARQAGRAARRLERLEEVVETFRPFLLEHDLELCTASARALSERLPPEERATCAWEPGAIDWRAYWTGVHLPGLRRWVFPALGGKRAERWPRRAVRLAPQEAARPAARGPA